MLRIPTLLSVALALTAVAPAIVPSAARAEARPFEGTTLRVLSINQPWGVAIKSLAKEFEEQTGAKVQFDYYAFDQTVQKVSVELSARSPAYDVVFLEASDIPRWAVGERLAPLDKAVAGSKTFDAADFVPSTIAGHSYGGKLYGLPYSAATQVLYFRGPVLKQAGFNLPPATWDEFLRMCAKLHTQQMACTAVRGKPSASENIWYWTQIFLGYGGNWVVDFPKDMTPTINSPEAVKALDVYKKLVTDYGIPGSVSAGFDEVVVALQQGNVAMAVEGAPLAGRILDPKLSKVGGQLGFAVPPSGPAGLFAPYTSQGWSVNAASRHKDAAAAFLMWATGKETMLKVALNANVVSVTRQSIWGEASFIAKYGYDFGYGSFTQAYANALRAGVPNYRLPIPEFREMADRVGLAVQEAVVGTRSPKEALDAAEGDVRKLLAEAGYQIRN
jgi:ABC-type glycerol-3-phosphate transport system substrate-binding protein